LLSWHGLVVIRRAPSPPEIRLDPTPTGDEEYRDWLSEADLTPTWNPDAARTRIDKIARRLAIFWSVFLVYMIIAQGNGDGVVLRLPWQRHIILVPHFHLQASEFIAVVTTTTASVFGFLVIVARYLFKARGGQSAE
jgi:hypothetical protein